ncbi:hypothetical protein [Demequina sp. NBRC 110057]|uniref:hypothetical protein n=1 Tax=Demequina sp. NBRC 110057 TaxID=1570346 RepID=UPI001177B297|nr:hypothetical protein [Demequina sp. NBRC 110057]
MRLAATAATVTTLSAGFLAGCSADDLGSTVATYARDAAQQAVEDATGGDVSLNFGDGATLPTDWPESIPVPDGELAAAATTGEGWTIATTGPSLALTDYVEQLEDAGFSDAGSGSAGDAATAHHMSDGEHAVTAAWASEPGGDSGLITVVVAPAGSGSTQ